MASASRTRPPPSGPRDGDGEAREEGAETLNALDVSPEAPRLPEAEGLPGEWPLPVRHRVEAARAAPTERERRWQATLLNRLLDDMGRGGGSREVADVFHGLLDGGALEGLEDETGRSCHEAAVEGLLALGFPYALEVRPEDVAHLGGRSAPASGTPWKKALPVLLALLAGVLGQLALEAWHPAPAERYPVTLLALTLFSLVGAVLGAPGSALRRVGGWMVGVVSLLVVLLSLSPGYGGVALGLAGLLAAFLAARQGD